MFLPAIGYQCLAIFAALRQIYKRRLELASKESGHKPPVSVLKPLRGLDPNTYQTFVSQIDQSYPTFEVLFGVRSEEDAAATEVHRLIGEFPNAPVRLITTSINAANGKVGVLMDLAPHARYPIWIVNDSDIKVGPDYLSSVVAPLSDPSIGLVTCLYRPRAHSIAGEWEALGIATDFMPSTLVAQLLGVREFGLGSTLAFRAADIGRLGGFAALADYLADDYELGKRISRLGKKVVLSTYTVETSIGESTWRGVWRHQVRWARTIRFSKPRGHAGLPITHAGVWTVLAFSSGALSVAGALLILRILSASLTSFFVLRSSFLAALSLLAPVWDLYAFAVWLVSFAGRKVRWRDQNLTINRQGRIQAR